MIGKIRLGLEKVGRFGALDDNGERELVGLRGKGRQKSVSNP